jgi:hypothetical protein
LIAREIQQLLREETSYRRETDLLVGGSGQQTIRRRLFRALSGRASIDDIIIAPDKAISYAIVNAGGFLGLAKHDVAVSVSKFKLVDGKLVLPGATKEALKASPEYAK